MAEVVGTSNIDLGLDIESLSWHKILPRGVIDPLISRALKSRNFGIHPLVRRGGWTEIPTISLTIMSVYESLLTDLTGRNQEKNVSWKSTRSLRSLENHLIIFYRSSEDLAHAE